MVKILIVDDDPHIRELARVFLHDEGFDVYRSGRRRGSAGAA